MKNYLLLFVAIGLEVLGTMLLPVTQSFTKLLPSTVSAVSYMLSVSLLAVLAQKLPLAVIYSSWAGLGVFSVALLSYIFYKQTLNWQTIAGLFLIVLGVTIVNMFKGESV
ncbi:SMR family transporter [Gammaproteobacteria bacterium]|nr:SMR family transporter [Gammaproteobacteria bacterium]